MKTTELKKGDCFRVMGPEGIGPDIWTWDGEYQEHPFEGAVIRRVYDGFTIVLPPTTPIVPLEPLEDL